MFYFPQEKNEVDDVNKASETVCALKWVRPTGTCFIKKIYAPSSSLLQGKHLPFTPSPLRLNIFRLFVILFLTQLYRYTPEIFLFSTATFKYTPSDELDKNIQQKWLGENLWHLKDLEISKYIQRTSLGLLFSHWNGYSHFRSGLNWFKKLKKKVL